MSFREIDANLALCKSDDKNDRRDATKNLPNLIGALDPSPEAISKAEEVLRTLQGLLDDEDRRTRNNAKDGVSSVESHLERLRRRGSGSDSIRKDSPYTSRSQVSGEISTAIIYDLKESMKGAVTYEGELKDIETSGELVVKNTGEIDRVFDVNFALEKGSSDLESQYHINEIQPGETWEKTYSYEWQGGESSPLIFRETIDTFPDTEEASNVLVFGRVMQTKVRFHFESNKNLDNIKMTKNLPAGFSEVTIESSSVGTPNLNEGAVEWNLEGVKEGESGELVIVGSFDVNNLDQISTGPVEVVFNSSDQLFSSAQLSEDEDKRTGSTRSQYVVESTEREDQPDYWDSKFVYNNTSEFPVKLLEVRISDDENEYYQLSEPFIVNAGSAFESEPWESFSETQPSFTKVVRISVGSAITITSEATLALEETQLVVANIEGDKKFVTADGEEVTVVPSYRETEVPAYIYVKNIGTIEYDNVVITDTIPAHFLPTKAEDIVITYVDPEGGEEQLSDPEYEFSYEPMDDNADVEHVGTFTINKNCSPDGSFKINYSPRAVKPLPDKEYISETKITANLVERAPPLELELVDTAPKLTVIHERRKLSVGKTVLPGSTQAEYEIILHFINRGSHDLKDVSLKDFVPDDFDMNEVSIEIGSEETGKESIEIEPTQTNVSVQDESGDLVEWTFEEIKKDAEIVVTYKISGKDPDDVYRASRAQISVA